MYVLHVMHVQIHVHIQFINYMRNTTLQSELCSKTFSQKAISELQEMLGDLRAERDLLKQANDRLMKG